MRILALLVTLILLSQSAVARADGVADEAEVNFRLGAERYQAGDYRAALAYFLASDRLAPNRNVRFNIARTFQRLGQFPEAYRWCQDALAGNPEAALRAQLEETLRAIEHEVAVLEIQTTPPGATVFVDRRDLGSVAVTPARIALPEGEHRILVHLDGYEDASSPPVTLVRGAVVPLALTLPRIVGWIDVRASGPTEVRLDGEDGPAACVAPCTLEVTPGAHDLYFRRAGFRTPPRRAQVVAGQSTGVRVEATARTGSILVTSDERDARVEVDGVAVGFTPVVVRNIPEGTRTVRVSLPGFTPVERAVEVREDRQSALENVALVPTREVTTASRISQSIEDAPASVSVITQQELEAFRYPTIAEALRGQRGVAISNDGAYTGLTLRGLGQPGDYGNRVLVLSDGATLNDNVLWQSYVGYDGRVDLGDVSRIELVRGPGSVLYGTGAVTGVVNLIPKGTPSEPTGEVRIAANDTRTARARAEGGLPLGRHGGFRISAAGAHGQGERMTLATTPTPTSVAGVNAFDAATGNARLEYRALTVQGFVTTRTQDVPNGTYGALLGKKPNELKDTRALVEARFEPALSSKVRLFTRAYGNAYRFASKQVYEGSTEGSTSRVDERYEGDWLGAEARVVAQVLASVQVTLGSEVQVSTKTSLEGTSREAGVSERYLHENQPYRIYAGYGLLEWQGARWSTLSAGARVDAWSTFGATVNPRVAWVVRPSQVDVVKLMGGRAFRAPSVYELRYNDGGTTQVRSDVAGNHLRPEMVWSSELEYSHAFADGWSALGSLHGQLAEDFIEQAPTDPKDPSSPVYYRNGGSSVYTAGGDVELKREMRAGWMFAANYGALVARYTHPAAGGGDAQVPNAPSHFGSVRGIAPLAAGLKLAVRTSLEAPRRISTDSRARTDAAAIADVVLSGQVSRSGFDYAVGLYNLFDFRYALPTDPTFVTRTMPQPGRTLLVSLGLRL